MSGQRESTATLVSRVNACGWCAFWHPRKRQVAINGKPAIPEREARVKMAEMLKSHGGGHGMNISKPIDPRRAANRSGPWPGLTQAEIDRTPYAQRVRQLEAEGLTTSDAQGVADAELMTGADAHWEVEA